MAMTDESRPGLQPGAVATGVFPQILADLKCAVIVTTYKSGQTLIFGSQRGDLTQHAYAFHRPMGIAVREGHVAIAANNGIVTYTLSQPSDAAPHGSTHANASLTFNDFHRCDDADIHDIAWAGEQILAVNTNFSCIETVAGQSGTNTHWIPPFISQLAPEDRCHLNGIALGSDGSAFVTALGRSDSPKGWRPHKADGGILMHAPSGSIITDTLSMPHSPRLFDGKLYVLNAGAGEILILDPQSGRYDGIVRLPGFLRGLCHLGGHLFVGLSRLRSSRTLGDLPLEQDIDTLKCGVAAIDLASGNWAGFIDLTDSHDELYDVQVLPCSPAPASSERHSAPGHPTAMQSHCEAASTITTA